jgi:hypothetical protein
MLPASDTYRYHLLLVLPLLRPLLVRVTVQSLLEKTHSTMRAFQVDAGG